MALFLVPLMLFAAVPAQASTTGEYQEELKRIEAERESLKGQIETADRKERVELTIEDNKLAGYETAYEKAIEYAQDQEKTMLAYASGNMSAVLDKGVPSQFIPIYQAAGEKYGVEWFLLASIHKIETNFSSLSNMISYAGAVGHMQFMPPTWEAYGVDGNGDGQRDPWNVTDAIYGAANYLAASGAAAGKVKEAVFAYNRADWYVEEVLSVAAAYKEAYSIGSGLPVVEVGKRWVNNSVYVFGGGRNQRDISRGYFDCSSFVHWAFKQTGQELGPLTSVSTETLKHLGKAIDPAAVQPGDLVFFDTYKIDGHVGIYIGDGLFIGAQSSTGVAVEDMTTGYWKEKFNGRIKRL